MQSAYKTRCISKTVDTDLLILYALNYVKDIDIVYFLNNVRRYLFVHVINYNLDYN